MIEQLARDARDDLTEHPDDPKVIAHCRERLRLIEEKAGELRRAVEGEAELVPVGLQRKVALDL